MYLSREDTQKLIDRNLKEIETAYGSHARLLAAELLTLEKSLHTAEKETRYIKLTEWNLYHPSPSVSALRNYINERHKNGFDKVLEREGKLWYIDENKYFEWKKSRFRNAAKSA